MSNHELLTRETFRETVFDRDNGCIVPWCDRDPVDAHHVLERSLWSDEGYYLSNGASVCETHHRLAERNHIPPQFFWRELDEPDPPLPDDISFDSDKWGEEFDVPPHRELRDYIKYPSTGHLPFSPEWDGTRVDFEELDNFVDVPLTVTVKMDGSNACIRRDKPVARNGHHAQHESFDMLKKIHSDIYWNIPSNIQIFGEWLYAEHSIHYTDDLALEEYFQVFGVYDTDYDLWLSWPRVKQWAESIGFPTVPRASFKTFNFDREDQLYEFNDLAEKVVENGHEGIVVRSILPYHYSQFEKRVGKYVRKGHVQPDARHWKNRDNRQNETLNSE